jgi:hypothetical protein
MSQNGKGKRPILGYNVKNWYANFGEIDWHKKWCAMCGKWTDHQSGACPELHPPKKDKKK